VTSLFVELKQIIKIKDEAQIALHEEGAFNKNTDIMIEMC